MKTAANNHTLRNIKAVQNKPLYEAAKKIMNEGLSQDREVERLRVLLMPHFWPDVAEARFAWLCKDHGTRSPDKIRDLFMEWLRAMPA